MNNKIKKWWRKQSYPKKTIICCIMILFVSFLVLFFYPTSGKITEDSLFLTASCNVKLVSYVQKPCGTYICNNEQDYTFKYLKEWKGYHGCNESTKGYDGAGRIHNLSCCQVVVLT